jgi:hypothetical protein
VCEREREREIRVSTQPLAMETKSPSIMTMKNMKELSVQNLKK